MPGLTDGTNTAIATTVTTNIFSGRPVEFLGVPAVMRLLLTADLPSATCQYLMNVGADQKAPISAGQPVNVAAVVGAGPKDDEDTIIPQIAIPAGARSQLNVTNGNAATNNVRFRAILA